jgi:hypothetical protein
MLEQINDPATSFEKITDMEHKAKKIKMTSKAQQIPLSLSIGSSLRSLPRTFKKQW